MTQQGDVVPSRKKKQLSPDERLQALQNRTPPRNIEAERAILGAIMLFNNALHQVLTEVQAKDFYLERHKHVFEAMLELERNSDPIDVIAVANMLGIQGKLDEAGGIEYLSELADQIPAIANVLYYTRIVREKSILRQLIEISTDIIGEAYEDVDDVMAFLDTSERRIFDIRDDRSTTGLTPAKDIVRTAFETIEQLYHRKERITGVATGFEDFDKITCGLQPSDMIVLAGRPSMGKCLTADTEILLEDGSLATMGEIVQRKEARLLSLGRDWRFHTTCPSAYIDDGVKPVFRVTTRLGRQIETTLTHPFLTMKGWQSLARLNVGDTIAVPRKVAVFGNTSTDPAQVRILACKSALDKTIPVAVFRWRRPLVALFLNRLFATDGWASVLRSGQAQVGYGTSSETMARQLQHLLLRFGVIASLKRRRIRYQDSHRVAWQLDITEATSLQTFCEEIGIFGKEEAVQLVREAIATRRAVPNCDRIPLEAWEFVRARKGSESWTSLARRAGIRNTSNLHVGKRTLSRSRLAQFAHALQDPELMALATSEVYWDTIVSIEPMGDKQVYDLTIPETHNFVANDICVHNTALVLNIATNAALYDNRAVAIFSLEMSKEQLIMRMLTAVARVDAGRLRTGHMKESDIPRLTQAATELAQSKIYIDDTGDMGSLEMRAKCRRLAMELGEIGLVIIDYLQLMKGDTPGGSREREISEISRGLKALAKELSVPVIALSQLNRSLERRPDKRPVMSDLRECVTGDTPVLLADGRRVPIQELVGETPEVMSMTPEGRIKPALADKVWCVGKREVYQVRLTSGRTLRATAKHRFYGANGWRRLGDIQSGDRLAVARCIPEPSETEEREIFWDMVKSVEPAGVEEVYDLTVPAYSSWLADSVISHNSGAIEQDADVIMFVYRDEVYHEDTEDKGIAEVIIGKQRNGPIGTVRLRFLNEYTRFDNLVPEEAY